MKLINRIILGVKEHPFILFRNLFIIYSGIWTILESTSFFFSDLQEQVDVDFYITLLFSTAVACFISKKPKKINIKIKNTNTLISISFGDLFEQKGHKVIPVNEFFDSELGDPVSKNSLHGKYISRILGGHSQSFDLIVDEKLRGTHFEEINRLRGKGRRYDIGTTIVVNNEHNNEKYFLVALTHTNLDTLKAYADVIDLLRALDGLWTEVRNHNGGDTVNIPLIGSGLSGIGLPINQLLRIILISILQETKKNEISQKINIILTPDKITEINLNELPKELG